MSLCLRRSLRKLKKLAPEKLHGVNLRMGGCEWKMGVCLLATARSKRYLDLGYASLNEYAERSLKLSGKKAYLLMLTARALEHLPLFSAAYQEGLLCWGKLRALQSVVTPETERTWLAYSLEHNSTQVVSAVSMSPRAWKKQQGLNASLKQKPFVAPPDVEQVFDLLAAEQAREAREKAAREASVRQGAGCDRQAGEPQATEPWASGQQVAEEDGVPQACPDSRAPEAQTLGVASRVSGPRLDFETALGREAWSGENAHEPFPIRDSFEGEERPFAPPTLADSAARKIRVTVEFTPDQYAIFEQSERCAKAQIGGRVDRAAAVVRMCEAHLAATTSRTRLKYQVVVHTSADGEHGWYETAQGPLPASAEAVRQATQGAGAKRASKPGRVARPSTDPAPRSTSDSASPSVANATSSATAESPCKDIEEADQQMAAGSASKRRREPVPAATLRALYLRAGRKCERCGCANAGLHVHHRRPVCEGGSNDLESLELLCGPCHSGHHQSDYLAKPHWQAARSKAVSGKPARERPGEPWDDPGQGSGGESLTSRADSRPSPSSLEATGVAHC